MEENRQREGKQKIRFDVKQQELVNMKYFNRCQYKIQDEKEAAAWTKTYKDFIASIASVPHKSWKVKPKRLDCPQVTGCSIGHKPRPLHGI